MAALNVQVLSVDNTAYVFEICDIDRGGVATGLQSSKKF
jgi:hypothetical protein